MNSKVRNALLAEASAAEAAELLAKLDRGYRSAYEAARQAEGTPDWGSRYSMAADIHQDATLAWTEAAERGLREPTETIPAMTARTYRQALAEPEHEAEAG
ncbi:MAG TPA: hypothetical protein VGQ26_28385 [Streptosporangiaceae bacterium]|jgi:hypothetical protein|nr:hypothetical protein [Streptosporangiaceae bacterium]